MHRSSALWGYTTSFRLPNKSPSPALLVLIALLIGSIVRQVAAAASWGHGSFEMTEWLINYSGGFVRRGLPGTLIGILSETTGLRANLIVIITSIACYLTLAAWLLRRATAYCPPALILSCVVMGIPAYQDSLVRKDCLGLLFLLACVSLGGWRGPKLLVIGGLNLIAAAALLCHETFAFYGLAAYVFLRDPSGREPWLAQVVGRAASLIPAGLCFLLTVIYHGTPAQAVAVNNSWIPLWDAINPANSGHSEPAATIAALAWTTTEGLSLSLHMLTSGFYQPLAWAVVFLISFLLLVLFAGRGSGQAPGETMQVRIRFVAILLCQLAFISPLFLLGVDYGRWLFFWVVSSMILHVAGRRAPAFAEVGVGWLFTRPRIAWLLRRFPAREWYLLVFGVPVCWNLRNFLAASPAGRHLEIILSWL